MQLHVKDPGRLYTRWCRRCKKYFKTNSKSSKVCSKCNLTNTRWKRKKNLK